MADEVRGEESEPALDLLCCSMSSMLLTLPPRNSLGGGMIGSFCPDG